jgi:hypothetical protein
MNGSVIVWDLETVPDLRGFAAANGLAAKTDEEVREAIGDIRSYAFARSRRKAQVRPEGGSSFCGRGRNSCQQRRREARDMSGRSMLSAVFAPCDHRRPAYRAMRPPCSPRSCLRIGL